MDKDLLNDDKWLFEQYQKHGATTIARKVGTYEKAVRQRLQALGVKIRSASESIKLSTSGKSYSTLNIDFFKNIDTEEKAYWLGFLMADGCVREYRSGCYQTSLELSTIDKELVYNFRDAIKCDGPIYSDDIRTRFVVTNTQFARNLISHNVVPHKTFNKVFPNLNKKLYRAYILGYFDADGSITLYQSKDKTHIERARFHIACGSYSFLEKIKEILEEEAGLCFNTKSLNTMHCNSKMTELYTAKMPNIAKIYDYFYTDVTIPFMQRKKDKFDTIISYYITRPLLIKRYSPNCLEINRT